ncbi:MAG: hypothetical protein KF708_20495 [Pirellulales bacterium]|nr:hypothetical protein [Pirellulales bacterium]
MRSHERMARAIVYLRPFSLLGALLCAAGLSVLPVLLQAQEASPETPVAEAEELGGASTAEDAVDAARAAEAPAEATEPNVSEPARPDALRREFIGTLLRVPAPLNGAVERRIQSVARRFVDEAKRRGQWPILIFEFQPGRNDFGKALDLARFLAGPQLTGATTVAYLPESISGHTVLPVVACDEIVMHPDARLGDASEGEQVISPVLLGGYSEIAKSRRTVPVAIVLGMLNPAVEVLEVETDTGRDFILASELEELQQRVTVISQRVLKPAGQLASFTGREGRELGFVKYLADDRRALARALSLPPEATEEDPSLGEEWRAIRVNVTGPITAASAEQARRMIQEQLARQKVNFIVVGIDSPGGAPADSLALANFLADLDPREVRTVALVTNEAEADAAFIALGCDQIVLADEARLGGGWQNVPLDEADAKAYGVSAGDLAMRKGRSAGVAAALVDPEIVVYEFRRARDGLLDYMTADEAGRLQNAVDWEQGREITQPGATLELDAHRAGELGLARHIVADPGEISDLYGLERVPRLVEPGWTDVFVQIIRTPGVPSLLLFIGFVAFYIEFKTPGIGAGAFVGLLAFALFFWGNYLGGTVAWLEIVLFAVGIMCILLEVFVFPGFGIFGFGGGLLVLASLVLASQSFLVPHDSQQFRDLRGSLVMVTVSVAGFVVAASFLRRLLPHTPGLQRVMLEPPSHEELETISRREALADYSTLLGHEGRTVTQLTPSGKARFDDLVVDVIADGELIAAGTEVVVVEARANRVVVKSVQR